MPDDEPSFDDLSGQPDSQARWVRHGTHLVPDTVGEERLDRYLSSRFNYRTRTQWVAIIKSGRVQVNGAVVRPSQMLRPGVRIDYEPEPIAEPSVSFEIGLLHEDDSLLAVDKPGDLPVHPSGRYFRNTLLSHLLEERGQTLDRPGLRVVHRLDRETSGAIVFGKTREVAGALGQQFENRTAKKQYLLVVHGSPQEDAFEVDGALGPRKASRIRKAVGVVPPNEGKPARTEFEVLARGESHALLLARPLTGRLHQIRVHVQHAGHPIVGDKMYGLDEGIFLRFISGEELGPDDRERLVHPRQALHAFRLSLTHPETEAALNLHAPLPNDLAALCRRLGITVPGELLGS
ncbi:MAG: RluA family pseudouridine synthase [Candidatus Eisenbacteria bacterium]